LSAAGVALLAGGSLLVLAGPRAAAQIVPPQPAPVTDYASYPANAELPLGCDSSGVVGVTFAVNGGTPVGSLGDIGPIDAGDTLTMAWVDILPACDPAGTDQSPIVLAMKSAPGPVFDAGVDQALDLPYAIDFMTTGEGGSLTYVLPPLNDDSFPGCFGQLDAIVGLPLAVVGPGGSFYSSGLRGSGPNLLISAWNGGYELCAAQETTTTTGGTTSTTVGTTTTSTPASTTTTAPTTTTTEATTTTAPPSSTTVQPPTTVTDPTSLTVGAAGVRATRTLAETGRSNGWVALAGLAGVGLGLVLVVVSRRRRLA
jgi:LPXTG-motif cell wall-anchored protein